MYEVAKIKKVDNNPDTIALVTLYLFKSYGEISMNLLTLSSEKRSKLKLTLINKTYKQPIIMSIKNNTNLPIL